MSGGASAATIAAVIGAGAAVGSTAYGVYNGQQQQGAQKKALKSQTTAQQEAETNALSTERKSAIALNDANKKAPNVAAILARAAQAGSAGLSSTMLTGPAGVDAGGLNLGKTTLLGA